MYRKRLTIELLPEEEALATRWRIAAIKTGKTLRDWLIEAAKEKDARQGLPSPEGGI